MSNDPIMRPEFNGAVESLRREIQTMAGNLDHRLREISQTLEKMREETGKVAVLETRVDALEEKDKSRASTLRGLVVAVIAALAGHLLPYIFGR